MNNIFKKFYHSFYLKTNGFIPAKPLNQKVFPGDFFQIIDGEMIVLGNIFKKGIIDPERIKFEYGIKLNPYNWDFSEGVTKPYSGRSSGHNAMDVEFNFSKQILAFDDRGSFSFRGFEPESVRFEKWKDIQDELIIKLTQVFYSFRALYLVTDVATVRNWTLALAGSKKAELEIAVNSENFGLVDIFGHSDAITVQAKDIEYHERIVDRKPVFFKAKKLTVRNGKIDAFISDLLKEGELKNEWVKSFFDYEFHNDEVYHKPSHKISPISILDMLQANELNPNTALKYFKWINANLDDIELLFK